MSMLDKAKAAASLAGDAVKVKAIEAQIAIKKQGIKSLMSEMVRFAASSCATPPTAVQLAGRGAKGAVPTRRPLPRRAPSSRMT